MLQRMKNENKKKNGKAEKKRKIKSELKENE